MNNINIHIANASGNLDKVIELINSTFETAVKDCVRLIATKDVDVIVVGSSYGSIPSLGVGGFSPSPNLVYLYIDPSLKKLTKENIYTCLMHEMHHSVRWRDPGYGENLKESLVTEGLATLFEEEVSGTKPIYAKVDINQDHINRAREIWEDKDYDHDKWFIFGDEDLPKWFGYSYGYSLVKKAAKDMNKTAAELVHEPAINLVRE